MKGSMKEEKNKMVPIFIPSPSTGTKEEVLKDPNGGIYFDAEQQKYIEVFTAKRLDIYDKLFGL